MVGNLPVKEQPARNQRRESIMHLDDKLSLCLLSSGLFKAFLPCTGGSGPLNRRPVNFPQTRKKREGTAVLYLRSSLALDKFSSIERDFQSELPETLMEVLTKFKFQSCCDS